MPPAICRVGKTWINLNHVVYARDMPAEAAARGEPGLFVQFASGFEHTFVDSADEVRKALDACHEANQPRALRLQKTTVTPPLSSASSPHVLPRFEDAHTLIAEATK